MSIKGRHTEEEKEACINECLNGADKYYLSGKYDVSIRTIDRWIANLKLDKVEVRISKRHNKIAKEIQYEIFEILSSNPIFYGYNTSEWNVNRIINYIKSTYDIEINRRMATNLMKDAIQLGYSYSIDQTYDDIDQLGELGYSIVLLDYIKIGRIKTLEIEPLGIREYTEDVLDVNLVIARADENIYLDVIVSEVEIVDKKRAITVSKVSDGDRKRKKEFQRKAISEDKYKVLNKIKDAERTEDIVFISTYDKDTQMLQRKRCNIKHFNVYDGVYNELLQSKYEGEYVKSIAQYMYDDKNRNRHYRCVADISKVVMGKIESYVSKVTLDKIKIKNPDVEEGKKIIIEPIELEKQRKYFKILNSDYIYNI